MRTVASLRPSFISPDSSHRLCAGGVYSFPLMSPALVEHLRFSQPQLTTIALAYVYIVVLQYLEG